MVLPALEHLEVFNAFFVSNLGSRFDTSVVWGMQYVIIKVWWSNPRVFRHTDVALLVDTKR